jgi:diguanylate cyclase (GGDEF)-like protein
MTQELKQYIKIIDEIANKLCKTILGDFDLTVQSDISHESVQKLIMIINFLLDTVRRKIMAFDLEAKEKEELIEELQKSNQIDFLTKIPNRFAFQNMLESKLLSALKNRSFFALAILDIDNFKEINDQSGHQIGDVFLKTLSSRIQKSLRQTDYIGRHGGDEFALLFSELTSPDDAGILVERIYQILEKEFHIEGFIIPCRVSIGIATFPASGTDTKTLFKNADLALYRSKSKGGNQYSFFTDTIHKIYLRKEIIFSLLKQPFNEIFTLHFQPLYDITKDKPILYGCEALLRTKKKLKMDISIFEIITLAEQRGYMSKLGKNIIELAFAKAVEFQKTHPKLMFSINLSAIQLDKVTFIKTIKSLTKIHQISPKTIIFEITESALIQNEDLMVSILKKLKKMGFMIAIDDFGKGYSAFTRLNTLPADVLKIDMAFTQKLAKDPQTQMIVKSIIQLALYLKLGIICEGVETQKQFDLIKSYGANAVQGYLLSRPLKDTKLKELLAKNTQQE